MQIERVSPRSCVEVGYVGTAILCGTSGIVLSFVSPVCGAGFLLSCVIAVMSAALIRVYKVRKTAHDSLLGIQRENKELAEANDMFERENDELHKINEDMKKLSGKLEDDVNMLTETIRVAGESSSDVVARLRRQYELYKNENEKHAKLLSQQTRLQLMQMFQHFDANSSFTLSEEEFLACVAFVHTSFPHVDVRKLKQIVESREVTLSDIELLVNGEDIRDHSST